MTLPQESCDDMNILPNELIITIFKLLPLESLLACQHVCQRWKKLAQDASIWRSILIVYSGKPGQSEVSERNLEIISSQSASIFCLKLQYVYNYQFIKSILQRCDNIMLLDLVMCRIGKDFEDDVKKWPNLKKINLKNSLLLVNNDDVIIQYDQFKYLKYLALSDFGLSSSNCYSLLKCTYLSNILIEKIKNLNIDYVKELIISKQHILETFHIYGGDSVDDRCLQLLSKCQMLKDLAIIRCENLTDAGLVALADLKHAEHLQIWNNINFTEINLLRTLSSPNLICLQSLSLSRIGNVSPVIVDVISEYYKNLKFLAVYQCPRIINTDYEKQLKSKFRNIDVVLY
ncbi:F-box and leucine-rich repeat protein 13-like [Plodia interpunctella]|uniref:F-box and leucine-rich repeat protein 13-like n=1 Tax=Plodia interpunctella TaxID=58824 RepID=UPI0023685860|nr:dynein regulatory complex subunit 6-like [Plodia interpunctella]XP_053605262.1 dynein regulatory complex subunit 6-like [Plodia interpunctella]